MLFMAVAHVTPGKYGASPSQSRCCNRGRVPLDVTVRRDGKTRDKDNPGARRPGHTLYPRCGNHAKCVAAFRHMETTGIICPEAHRRFCPFPCAVAHSTEETPGLW